MSIYLLKFLEKEEYVNDLLNGKLYMNTLKYFKEKESTDRVRSDIFETPIEHKHKTSDYIQIGNLLLSKEKGEISNGMITTTTNKYDFCNILCFYSLWRENENEELFIDERNKEFGYYCICINNIQEFLKRVVKSTDENDFICHYNRVKYINKLNNYRIKEKDIPFTKFDNFKYQKEFRIAIDTKKYIDNHYVLEIGDIRDISFVTRINKLKII